MTALSSPRDNQRSPRDDQRSPRDNQPMSAQSTGHGIGLRACHYDDWLVRDQPVAWVEAVTENFMGRGGRPRSVLEHVRKNSNVILHGVSLSIGSTDPLDKDYLTALKALSEEIEASIVSDHLCFGSYGGHHGHDLWPLPYTPECIDHVCARVDQVQEHLGRQFVIENVSSYVQYRDSAMPEWEFLTAIAQRTGAGILLDVNNIYVSSQNHAFDANDYVAGIDPSHVKYIHLAGHADRGDYLLDNHGGAVCDEVWEVYRQAVKRVGAVPSIMEWDSNVPSLERVLEEIESAAKHEAELLAKPDAKTQSEAP